MERAQDRTDEPSPARPDRAVRLVLLLGLVAMLGVRLHVLDDELPNPDIAGIVYNAELLLDGGLPYVDTAEIKPPGAFVLAAISMGLLGRSLEALQLWHALWLLLGGAGVWWAARAVHDDEDEPSLGPRSAAVATAVYLVSAAMFSYNYSSWMVPASAISVGAALRGLRRDRARDHLLAGAAAMLAGLTIQRAAVLAILLPTLWLWAKRRGWSGARPRVVAWWIAGGGLTLLPLVAWYGAAGRLGALASGLVPLSVANDYAAAAGSSGAALVLAVVWQLLRVFWFPCGLVTLALVATATERPRPWSSWIPGALWLLLSIVGAGLGGARYYLHYLVQYAPALGLLAGHPALVRAATQVAAAGRPRLRARLLTASAGLLALAQLLEIGLGHGHRYEAMARRLEGGLTAAQAAGEHIRLRTTPEQTVQAWGWTAWRVYYWAQRRAPGRVYKPLGSVTTFNTNTELGHDGGAIHFRPGPLADEMIEAFDRHPPAYFVYSPSMVQTFGARPDPLEEFTALAQRLMADYVPEAQYGDLRLFRRRELGPSAPTPPSPAR